MTIGFIKSWFHKGSSLGFKVLGKVLKKHEKNDVKFVRLFFFERKQSYSKIKKSGRVPKQCHFTIR